MHILENVSLKLYSTMRLGGKARYLVEAKNKHDLQDAVWWATDRELPIVVIGGGSNIIWRDEGYPGMVIVNKIRGFEITRRKKTRIKIGAGMRWDETVALTVGMGLTGIEALSLIPGTSGAAPVQNIGAYGQQLSDTLKEVEVLDVAKNKLQKLSARQCGFGYRRSRFNGEDKGKYVIMNLTLELEKKNPKPPFYKDVESYLEVHPVDTVTPAILRKAVMEIRHAKLPDPAIIANTGSFFRNPVVTKAEFAAILLKVPEINVTPDGWAQPPRWIMKDGHVKIAAGWLVEQAGFSEYHDKATGMATWPRQNLVLINEHAKTTADLLKFKKKITAAVKRKFGITLEQEPELLP